MIDWGLLIHGFFARIGRSEPSIPVQRGRVAYSPYCYPKASLFEPCRFFGMVQSWVTLPKLADDRLGFTESSLFCENWAIRTFHTRSAGAGRLLSVLLPKSQPF